MKTLCTALLISTLAAASFAQAPATADAASAPKHKLAAKFKKLKASKPAASAVNPEATPDKKGGN